MSRGNLTVVNGRTSRRGAERNVNVAVGMVGVVAPAGGGCRVAGTAQPAVPSWLRERGTATQVR